jgi:hypothetical protein
MKRGRRDWGGSTRSFGAKPSEVCVSASSSQSAAMGIGMRRLKPRWYQKAIALTVVVQALASPLLGHVASAQQISDQPVELTTVLLDHWLAAMRQIGATNLDSPALGAMQEFGQPARLDETCSKAGFATPEQCGCTVLYVAVLMTGFEQDAQGFIDPAQALQRRIGAVLKRADLSDADIQTLARQRKTLFALRKALPKGVPPEHLTLIDGYVHEHLTADVNLWRQLAVGMKASETSAIGNRCTKLPALTAPAK